MEEAQVTVDGKTYDLEAPFMVIATQNPIEMEGTYALPEAQRDRFMVRLSMGYPVESAEIAMLSARDLVSPLEELEPVTDAAEGRTLIEVTNGVHVARTVQQYAVALATATRRSPDLRLGASPRATLHLIRAAKAWAAMQGREYVLPDDVRDLVPQVFPHRLLPTMEATMSGRRTSEVVQQALAQVPVPQVG
jgi:MoxR-like ATPase